jgi:ribosomal protein L30
MGDTDDKSKGASEVEAVRKTAPTKPKALPRSSAKKKTMSAVAKTKNTSTKDCNKKSEATPVRKKATLADVVSPKREVTSEKKIKIILVKSLIGNKKAQIASAVSLGLKKIGDTIIQPSNPQTIGKINKISHLVAVERV